MGKYNEALHRGMSSTGILCVTFLMLVHHYVYISGSNNSPASFG